MNVPHLWHPLIAYNVFAKSSNMQQVKKLWKGSSFFWRPCIIPGAPLIALAGNFVFDTTTASHTIAAEQIITGERERRRRRRWCHSCLFLHILILASLVSHSIPFSSTRETQKVEYYKRDQRTPHHHHHRRWMPASREYIKHSSTSLHSSLTSTAFSRYHYISTPVSVWCCHRFSPHNLLYLYIYENTRAFACVYVFSVKCSL